MPDHNGRSTRAVTRRELYDQRHGDAGKNAERMQSSYETAVLPHPSKTKRRDKEMQWMAQKEINDDPSEIKKERSEKSTIGSVERQA